MKWKSLLGLAVVVVLWAVPARAQGVQLRFHDGLVTLSARNAPLRAILTEWARLGGATIVNGERVVGPPLTLELNAIPERQALDTLLRSVSGYMLGTRAAGTPGISVFDRILILPTSSGPQNPPPNAAARFPGASPRPMLPQPARPPILADVDDLEEDPPQDVPPDDDVPVVNPLIRPRMPQGSPTFPQPMIVPQPEPDDDQPDPQENPQPRPTSPFGLPPGATARPGVITPVPQAPQQRGVPQPDPEP
jgi:hypothetical protein